MFIVKIDQPGVSVNPIRRSDGNAEFCGEFFDDVPLSPDDIIAELNPGWTAAKRLLVHERNATGGASPYVSGSDDQRETTIDDLLRLAT